MLAKNILINNLREPVITGQTRPEAWRRLQLRRIENLLEAHEKQVIDSLATDLGKPPTEAMFEVIALKQELKLAKRMLSHWMRPKRIQVPMSLKPAEAMVTPEPLGCVLIIGPWNYPFSLLLQPLISALAAGNTAVLKPSEHAPSTSELIARVIPKHFPSNLVQVVEGDGEIAASLVDQSFDHIFFTGGGEIGKKVMSNAAKNLTPLTLELGGKSPAIVIEGANIEITAKRLVWGKGLNAGQTCIAPDHLIVQEQINTNLLEEMKKTLIKFYGINPITSPHLANIINDSHFNRLKKLLEEAQKEGRVLFGGEFNEESRKIAPTLISVNDRKDPLMSQEIFGPLLPIMKVPNFETALAEIRKQPRPLAIYLFGGTSSHQQKLLNTTSSGGVCFNDVVMQAGIPELPFGGIGASGMGQYHGLAGFETFSHKKSVLKRPFWLDLDLRYPPYNIDIAFLKKLLN